MAIEFGVSANPKQNNLGNPMQPLWDAQKQQVEQPRNDNGAMALLAALFGGQQQQSGGGLAGLLAAMKPRHLGIGGAEITDTNPRGYAGGDPFVNGFFQNKPLVNVLPQTTVADIDPAKIANLDAYYNQPEEMQVPFSETNMKTNGDIRYRTTAPLQRVPQSASPWELLRSIYRRYGN